ncbi:hypothetical protein Tco_1572140 [Tanacetum coccineum]
MCPNLSLKKKGNKETVTKNFSRKKKKDPVVEVVEEKSSSAKKSASKEKSGTNKLSFLLLKREKDVKKDKPKEETLKPSDEVKAAISELLKQVDFNMLYN